MPWFFVVLVLVGACAALVVWYSAREDARPPLRDILLGGRASSRAVAEMSVTEVVREAPLVEDSPIWNDDMMDTVPEALALEKQGELLEAREKLLAALTKPLSRVVRERVEEILGRINVALLTTPRAMPGKVEYVIKPGDSMAKIASEFVCPVLLIQKINNIANPDRIRPGDVLRVMDHPKFALEISKRDNTLLVTLDGKFFKRYSVGTGTYGTTPVGTFDIDDKIEDPPWWKDGKAIPFGDPENILGTRWMRIKATGDTTPVSGYGIHGTWENDSIGKQSSAGCIRMRNADVEEVYMMVPRGTPVTIVE